MEMGKEEYFFGKRNTQDIPEENQLWQFEYTYIYSFLFLDNTPVYNVTISDTTCFCSELEMFL